MSIQLEKLFLITVGVCFLVIEVSFSNAINNKTISKNNKNESTNNLINLTYKQKQISISKTSTNLINTKTKTTLHSSIQKH